MISGSLDPVFGHSPEVLQFRSAQGLLGKGIGRARFGGEALEAQGFDFTFPDQGAFILAQVLLLVHLTLRAAHRIAVNTIHVCIVITYFGGGGHTTTVVGPVNPLKKQFLVLGHRVFPAFSDDQVEFRV